MDSDELLRIQSSPEHLAIVGAGYIGCEFASIYRTLGCAVTLIEKESRILPGWEREAGERVAQMLEMRGVTIQLERNVALHQIEEYEEGVRIPMPGYRRSRPIWLSSQPAEDRIWKDLALAPSE